MDFRNILSVFRLNIKANENKFKKKVHHDPKRSFQIDKKSVFFFLEIRLV